MTLIIAVIKVGVCTNTRNSRSYSQINCTANANANTANTANTANICKFGHVAKLKLASSHSPSDETSLNNPCQQPMIRRGLYYYILRSKAATVREYQQDALGISAGRNLNYISLYSITFRIVSLFRECRCTPDRSLTRLKNPSTATLAAGMAS